MHGDICGIMQGGGQHILGGDRSQIPTIRVQQQRQFVVVTLSDVAPNDGGLSDMLRHRLRSYGLGDLDVLFRCRQIVTLQDFQVLEFHKKVNLLHQAQCLLETLQVICEDSVKFNLMCLFCWRL